MAKRKSDVFLRPEDLDSEDKLEEEIESPPKKIPVAPPEVLEKRTIRVAARRLNTNSSSPAINPFANISLTNAKPDLSAVKPILEAFKTKKGLDEKQELSINQNSLKSTNNTSSFGQKSTQTSTLNIQNPSLVSLSSFSSSVATTSVCNVSSSVSFSKCSTPNTAIQTKFSDSTSNIGLDPVSTNCSPSPRRPEQYYAKLIKLNQAFYKWIKSYMDQSPTYDYSPVCKDYLEYIGKMKKDYPLETTKTLKIATDDAEIGEESDTNEEANDENDENEDTDSPNKTYSEFVDNIKNPNSSYGDDVNDKSFNPQEEINNEKDKSAESSYNSLESKSSQEIIKQEENEINESTTNKIELTE